MDTKLFELAQSAEDSAGSKNIVSPFEFDPGRRKGPVLPANVPFHRASEDLPGLAFTGRGVVVNINTYFHTTAYARSAFGPPVPFHGFVRTWVHGCTNWHATQRIMPVCDLGGRDQYITPPENLPRYQPMLLMNNDPTYPMLGQVLPGMMPVYSDHLHYVNLNFVLPGPGWKCGVTTWWNQAASSYVSTWFEVLELVPEA